MDDVLQSDAAASVDQSPIERATALVAELDATGPWPDPSLMEAILNLGEDAVTPLLEHLAQIDAEDERGFAVNAAELLCEIGDARAIPAVVALFRTGDDGMIETLEQIVSGFGPAAVPYLTAIIADDKLDWYPRSMAVEAAFHVADSGSDQWLLLHESLRTVLKGYVERADTLANLPAKEHDNAIDVISYFVSHLAKMHREEEDRPLIEAAFAADLVDGFVIEQDDIERIYRRETPYHYAHYERGRYVEDYTKRLAEYRADVERRNRAPLRHPWLAGLPPERAAPRMFAPPKPYVAPPKLGRNDPCWCGSGKKYKKCHLGKADDRPAG